MARRPEKALTAVQVKQLKTPGRHGDGNGLYLVIDPSGARRWLLRIVVQGRRRDIGLGSASIVGLAEARQTALDFRKVARQGGDPLADRRRVERSVPTFEDAAEAVHNARKGGWKNEKHGQQWLNTLKNYVYPELGSLRVDQITTPDVLRVLGPIWLTKPETARRVRQRVGVVLDWAKAAGYRSGDNPVAGVAKGLPKQADAQEHHAALPYQEVPAFIAALQSRDAIEGESTRLAFEFLILTASRTSEVLGARWSEINFETKLWTVPAERMNAKKPHRVPLGQRAIELLRRARELAAGSEYVFPGRTAEKPKSNMVLLKMLQRVGVKVTAHGFRSSFRDWAAEVTNYPRELAEMALAHTVENKVEAAYRRGDLLTKRAEMMEAWSQYCLGSPR